MTDNIEKVLIVGGGTAGWMAAATLGLLLENTPTEVHLIESEAIGTVGVGEATIPPIIMFNEMLGIDEDTFVKETNATFKLGIEFNNWGGKGESYIHPFGDFGIDFDIIPFYQYWVSQNIQGLGADLFDYSLMVQACRKRKFMRPLTDRPKSALAGINYAFQFDAGLYAAYLRRYAESKGVRRHEGRITNVRQTVATGFIEAVETETGQVLEADFFIDCSGFRGLLIEGALETGYEDWRKWLPCDRAIAVGCEKTEPLIPYTKATAHDAGWQWRIPLQHRTGNGHVYCSEFISDDEAASVLLENLDAEPISDPKFLRFMTGRRKKFWNKNVLALGLAAGFMEPLESTSLHLVQTGLARLMTHFPDKRFVQADIDAFNDRTVLEYERVRDFLVLHYSATKRTDTAFWRHCQSIERPPHLVRKIEQFMGAGRVFEDSNDLFSQASWLAVMYGQGIKPQGCNPITGKVAPEKITEILGQIHNTILNSVDVMPGHTDFIEQHCLAKSQ
ncbi:MAG: tryptophan halogenase family protein [Hyphomonadaceae bacterium]